MPSGQEVVFDTALKFMNVFDVSSADSTILLCLTSTYTVLIKYDGPGPVYRLFCSILV
jgi:hypothetical protein